MRILIYSYNYYPEPIGIAPLMTELAEGLVKRGHQVQVVTAMPWYPEGEIYSPYRRKLYLNETRNGVKIKRCYIWTRRERSLKNRALFEISFAGLSFWQALTGGKPDVILLTVPGLPVCVPAVLISWLYRTPIVLNLQDILPDAAVHVGLITNQKLVNILKKLEQFAYSNAEKIAVIARGFTENITKKGVDKDKIVEISNWVDINFIRPLPQKSSYFRHQYNLENKFIVLYSGNIALTQGLENLMDAGNYLANIDDIAIVIVGEGKALKKLELYCQKQGVKNVYLIPFQDREKLPEMLAAANVGMVIQKKNVIAFNMPSKIQVLLASGRAILASVPSSGTAAQAITKSGGGICVTPEDPGSIAAAIKELYDNPEKTKQLGVQGRKYAEENYSFELALDQYEKLFAEVISQGRK